MLTPHTLWRSALACLLASSSAAIAEPIPVTAQPLAELAVHSEWRAPATVVSDNDTRLSAEVTARIVDIPVQVGEIVERDALLLRLEDADLQLSLQRAQASLESLAARLELARYQLTRARTLSEKQAVSDELLKQRETDVKTLLAEQAAAEANLTLTQRQLAKTRIRAPFKAIVIARLANLGELANPGTPLLRIVDAEHLEVTASIQADAAAGLEIASAPELHIGGSAYPLSLRTITPYIDPKTRTREARLRFGAGMAMPGSAGELVWQDSEAKLPADLLSRRNGKLGVFVVEADKARFVNLTEAQEGRPAATTLGADSLIVVQGRFRLQDGDELRLQQ